MDYLVRSYRLDEEVRAEMARLIMEHGSANKALRVKLLGKPKPNGKAKSNGGSKRTKKGK